MLYRVLIDGRERHFAAMAEEDPREAALRKWPDLDGREWEAKEVKRQFDERAD